MVDIIDHPGHPEFYIYFKDHKGSNMSSGSLGFCSLVTRLVDGLKKSSLVILCFLGDSVGEISASLDRSAGILGETPWESDTDPVTGNDSAPCVSKCREASSSWWLWTGSFWLSLFGGSTNSISGTDAKLGAGDGEGWCRDPGSCPEALWTGNCSLVTGGRVFERDVFSIPALLRVWSQ